MYGYLRSEKEYLNWLRSGLRRVWSKHPVKLGLLQHKRIRRKSISGKIIWHYQCESCGEYFKTSEVEVNHKNTVGTMTKENFGECAKRMLMVTENDLEILCKSCHGLVTYVERYGGDLRTARIAKKVITFGKLNSKEQVAKLQMAGIPLPSPNTEKARKEVVRQFLQKHL